MDGWLARYASALAQGLMESDAQIDLGEGGEEQVLGLAGKVAHGSERRNAPLATFLAGCYVALRVSEGAEAAKALEEAVRVAQRLLPAEPTESAEPAQPAGPTGPAA